MRPKVLTSDTLDSGHDRAGGASIHANGSDLGSLFGRVVDLHVSAVRGQTADVIVTFPLVETLQGVGHIPTLRGRQVVGTDVATVRQN